MKPPTTLAWKRMAKRLNDAADNYLGNIPDDPDYATDSEIKRHDRAWDRLHKALAAYRNLAGRGA